MMRFDEFDLSPESLRALQELGIEECTSVQEKSLGPMLAWRDTIVQAPTGTGKTFAYGLPIVEHSVGQGDGPLALILSPTRELAIQIDADIKSLCVERPEVRSLVLYGGQRLSAQSRALRDHPQIVIATPGRLIDHYKRRNIDFSKLRTLILDEADRMLDMGFIDDVRYIMGLLPGNIQIGLFSATLSREVLDISWIYQKDPVEVVVEAENQDKPKIHEYYVIANGIERVEAIEDILLKENLRRSLVFVNMKQSADICARKLESKGLKAGALQGDMAQAQRNRVMESFRSGEIDILVGTDVAARGLDIDDVEVVFNYDLPPESENYIHRIGRTGRAGREGLAFTFVAPGSEAEFDLFCRRLHIHPELYVWERPAKTSERLSAEAEAALVERIRAQSQWLKKPHEERYDPLASSRQGQRGRRGSRRDKGFGSQGNSERRPSGKRRSGQGRRSGESRPSSK